MRLSLLSLVIIVSLIAGCSLGKSPTQKELDAARILWDSVLIEDYQFQLRVSCFCPQEIVQPVLISVIDGVVTDRIYAETGVSVLSDYFNRADTVEKLFEIIQEAIDTQADSLTVTYDKQTGYPSSIIIDQIAQAVDEEIAYFVESFTILK
ncbi:DUF6174 domain-containing protein [Candidatus Dehalogenimonas loeffleri]|uniref:DUF6174 domain-containing protein n=1 Tax=Candidatus Dehalogenimonas loeffleri TaxID=3127115 RepID=A0ABZ2J411_9CHLR